MKIIGERALQREEIVPAEALQQEGLWHLVASEGGLCKGDRARKGEHERWEVREVSRGQIASHGKDLGFSPR